MPIIDGTYVRPTNEEFEAMGAGRLNDEDFQKFKVGFMSLVDKMDAATMNMMVVNMKDYYGIVTPVVTEPVGVPIEEVPKVVNVILESFGSNKIAVIRAVRTMLTLPLKESRDVVSNCPSALFEGIDPEEAQEYVTQLEGVGATVSVK